MNSAREQRKGNSIPFSFKSKLFKGSGKEEIRPPNRHNGPTDAGAQKAVLRLPERSPTNLPDHAWTRLGSKPMPKSWPRAWGESQPSRMG